MYQGIRGKTHWRSRSVQARGGQLGPVLFTLGLSATLAACGDDGKPESPELTVPPTHSVAQTSSTIGAPVAPAPTLEVDAGPRPIAMPTPVGTQPMPGLGIDDTDAGTPKDNTSPSAVVLATAGTAELVPSAIPSVSAPAPIEGPLTWPDGSPVAFDTRTALKAVPSDAADSWTLLVYVNADNSSEADALKSLTALSLLPDSNKLTILAQVDRAAASETTGARPGYTNAQLGELGEFASVKRLQIHNGKFEWLEDWGERNLGDASVLSEFISWGLKRSPTGHTALVLRGPGGAWRGFGPDETSNFDALTLPELSSALQKGLSDAGRSSKLDLVGFDSPLMANLETAATLSPYAEQLVASEELTRSTGWDWSAFEVIQKQPTSARELGKALVTGYKTNVGNMPWATLSQCDLTTLPSLQKAFFRLQLKLDAMTLVTLGRMRNASPEVALGLHLDLIDIAQLADEAEKAQPSLQPEAEAVKQALSAVCSDHVSGPGATSSRGLSVYFPTNPQIVANEYADVPGMSVWQTFVKHYASQAQTRNLKPLLGLYQTMFENGVSVTQVDLDPTLVQQLVAQKGQVISIAPAPVDIVGNMAQLRWKGGRSLQVVQGSPKWAVYFENRVHSAGEDVSVSLNYSSGPNVPAVPLQSLLSYSGQTLALALNYWNLGGGYWWEVPLGAALGTAQVTKDVTGTFSAKLDLSKGPLSFAFQDAPAPDDKTQGVLLLQDALGNRVER